MTSQLCIILLFVTAIFASGCAVSPGSISEVALSYNSGLGRSAITITLRRDGTAQCKCLFFWLREEPEPDLDTTCGRLLSTGRASFTKIPQSHDAREFRLEGTFNGKVSEEQFDQLAKLIVESGYFSMKDEYLERGVMDAPPTTTRVVYTGGVKEISNQLNKGGKKLSEVEGAIFKAADGVDWAKS